MQLNQRELLSVLKKGSVLFTPTPSLLPVNRELPSLLNLRIAARWIGSHAKVAAVSGNNYYALRKTILDAQPNTIVVEFSPVFIDSLVDFFLSLPAYGDQQSRIIIIGENLHLFSERLKIIDKKIVLGPSMNLLRALGLEHFINNLALLRPVKSELAKQPYWEKTRVTPALGCPENCFICDKKLEEPTQGDIRPVSDVIEEIIEKIENFSVRQFEVIGISWANDPNWSSSFLTEIIKLKYDIRLRVMVGKYQLSSELLEYLTAAGCRHLTIRCNLESKPIDAPLQQRLRSFSQRGYIVSVLDLSPELERLDLSADYVRYLFGSLCSTSVHLFCSGNDFSSVACHELPRIAGKPGLIVNIRSNRANKPAIIKWANDLADLVSHRE